MKFCPVLKNNATETLKKIKVTYGEQIVGRTQIFESFTKLKSGEIYVKDSQNSGCPLMSRTNEHVD